MTKTFTPAEIRQLLTDMQGSVDPSEFAEQAEAALEYLLPFVEWKHQFGLDGLELFLAQAVHSYFCSCKHEPNGDPRGKKAWEDPDFARKDGDQ